ncbi:histidine ammonia-lyase [Ciona intestinalis]
MIVYVEVSGRWLVIPCNDTSKDIAWLISEVKTRSLEADLPLHDKVFLTSPDEKLFYSDRDKICEVLHDKEFLKIKNGPPAKINVEQKSDVPTIALSSLSISQSQPGHKTTVILDGNSLNTETLLMLSTGEYKIEVAPYALRKVAQSRKLLNDIIDQKKVVYGVSTGFGNFANVVIPPEDLRQLQTNLIESHCVGVGPPLSPDKTRMLLALRTNILCKGYSGISTESLKTLVNAFNASCLPWIPEQGTVGASGDLAPLAHMALGMMGKGRMWSPSSGWCDAGLVLKANNIEPLQLKAKEGLALINGTQFIASIGSEAVERAKYIALQADVVAALTLEALLGTSRAFDSAIHAARPHKGQQAVAQRIRRLLQYGGNPSEITESHKNCPRVQDAYTLRCCPQVHGVAHDTIDFVKDILNVELNSATDNPMVLIERRETISGGNFHGEYPAKALDYLAIGVHELGGMSERRIERLNNPAYSNLPAFLVKNGGLNSGFMMPHCTAAALVSENKCLCHPSSVDSLSTSAGQEDHVSMGGWAARKALKVVSHVEYVIAIELLCACQAIEFLRPLKSTEALEAVHALVRTVVPPYDKDRVQSTDMEAVVQLLRSRKVWKCVEGIIGQPITPAANVSLSSSPTSSSIA